MILALAVAAAVAATLGASSAPSDTGAILTSAKHVFWGQSTAVDSASSDPVWHGGNAGPGAIGAEPKPGVYLVWWGGEWAGAGFQTTDTDGKLYSSKTLQTYLSSFFQNLGGSPWANIQTQYCNTLLPGSTSCVGA